MRVQKGGTFFFIFFMLGFLAGIVYTNVVSKDYVATIGIFNEYFLTQYEQTDVNLTEYLWYILKVRVTPLIMIALLGCLKIKKVVVASFLIWTGLLSGTLLASAVMKMGIKGIILCLIAMLPQVLFYFIGYFILLWYLFSSPTCRWNLQKMIVLVLSVGVGVILECYVNPLLIKLFIKTI